MNSRQKQYKIEFQRELRKAKDRFRKNEYLRTNFQLRLPETVPTTKKELNKVVKQLRAITVKNVKRSKASITNPYGDISKLSNYLTTNYKRNNKRAIQLTPKQVTQFEKALIAGNRKRKKYFLPPMIFDEYTFTSEGEFKKTIQRIQHYTSDEMLYKRSDQLVKNFAKSLTAMINDLMNVGDEVDDEKLRFLIEVRTVWNSLPWKEKLRRITNLTANAGENFVIEVFGSDGHNLTEGAMDVIREYILEG